MKRCGGGGGARAHPRYQKFYCGVTQTSIPKRLQHRGARGLLRLMSAPSMSSAKHQSGKYELFPVAIPFLYTSVRPSRVFLYS